MRRVKQKKGLGVVALICVLAVLPLLPSMALGALFAVLIFPALEFLEKKKIPLAYGAFLLTFLLSVLFLLPLSLFLIFGAKTALSQLQSLNIEEFLKSSFTPSSSFVSPPPSSSAQDWLNSPSIQRYLDSVTHFFSWTKEDVVSFFHDSIKNVGTFLAEWLGGILTQLPSFGMNLFIVVLSLYFFLLEARTLVYFLRRTYFFSSSQTEYLMSSLREVSCSVLLASLISGSLQAGIALIVSLSVGLPYWIWVGCFVFMSSFVPVIGALPITIGIFFHQWFLDRPVVSFILFVHVLTLLFIDYFVRPMVLKERANVHPFLALIGALGGLQTMGLLGIFFGPILMSLLATLFSLLFGFHKEESSA